MQATLIPLVVKRMKPKNCINRGLTFLRWHKLTDQDQYRPSEVSKLHVNHNPPIHHQNQLELC